MYLKTKHELTVSDSFNIQFEFTAGDRLTMASRPENENIQWPRTFNLLNMNVCILGDFSNFSSSTSENLELEAMYV